MAQVVFTPVPVRVAALFAILCTAISVFCDIYLSFGFKLIIFGVDPRARAAMYAFFVFTATLTIAFVVQLVDCTLVLVHNRENVIFTPLAKSLVLMLGDLPLSICLLVICVEEKRYLRTGPWILISSVGKLVGLLWECFHFVKLNFCWFFLPCSMEHDMERNTKECFRPSCYTFVMFLINVLHIAAICVVIIDIVLSADEFQHHQQMMEP